MSEQPKDKNAEFRVEHMQDFHVVCRKAGVETWQAKPEDYVRLEVRASSTQAAQAAETVLERCKTDGLEPLFATNPGLTSEEEQIAARNARRSP